MSKNKNPRGNKKGGKRRKQKKNTKRSATFQESLSWKEKENNQKYLIEQAKKRKNL